MLFDFSCISCTKVQYCRIDFFVTFVGINYITLINDKTMVTKNKKTTKSVTKEVDARSRIKPRGLAGIFKGEITLNGTSDEVFSLNRLGIAR
jgi:hypothetical protein